MVEILCVNCSAVNSNSANYCLKCGKILIETKAEKKSNSLGRIVLFYIAFLVFIAATHFIYTEYPYNFTVDISVEVAFGILTIGFCLFDWKSILKLYKIPQFNYKIVAFTIIFPLFSSIGVYYLMEYSNIHFFELESENLYESYFYLENSLVWSIIFVAITPALFEELAFRGYLFTELRKVTNEKITILATAFIFALIHISFISLVWIFPFGLVLGWLRSKYKTLWYGMLIHFTHNLIVLLLDYYYSYNDQEELTNFLHQLI